MNIRLSQQQNDTLLSIEADFDKFVAENFGDICQALAKHLRILIELEAMQRNHGIKTEELIAVIRRSKDEQNVLSNLIHEFNISPEAACYVLTTSISELNQILDPTHLRWLIDHQRHNIHPLLEL